MSIEMDEVMLYALFRSYAKADEDVDPDIVRKILRSGQVKLVDSHIRRRQMIDELTVEVETPKPARKYIGDTVRVRVDINWGDEPGQEDFCWTTVTDSRGETLGVFDERTCEMVEIVTYDVLRAFDGADQNLIIAPLSFHETGEAKASSNTVTL